jgi:XTP/dITP diphosphohydrolase
MTDLVFATGNPHKVAEVKQLTGPAWKLRSLADMGLGDDLPENQDTLEGNALEKARYVHARLGCNCFAEDTGLEIEALGGAPGVYSARYAGESKDPGANLDRVLSEMENASNRRAQFRTVIALILDGKEYLFEGAAPGIIRRERSGSGGFGYDPIFEPEGYSITFAEMDAGEKNRISHRGKAMRALIAFLQAH